MSMQNDVTIHFHRQYSLPSFLCYLIKYYNLKTREVLVLPRSCWGQDEKLRTLPGTSRETGNTQSGIWWQAPRLDFPSIPSMSYAVHITHLTPTDICYLKYKGNSPLNKTFKLWQLCILPCTSGLTSGLYWRTCGSSSVTRSGWKANDPELSQGFAGGQSLLMRSAGRRALSLN